MQTTNHLLMIRPANFGFNAQTAVNNAFQVAEAGEQAHEKALTEFDGFVKVLRENGVDVTVIDDEPAPHTPDSIFPNNWVSFHGNGTVCLYPMFAENRRAERKPAVLEKIGKKFKIGKILDLTYYEEKDAFLEGTGSMVLDRDNKIAFACPSPRTDKKVLHSFCERMGYRPMTFEAVDTNKQAIYHTNVMMCMAEKYVVICLDALPRREDKDWLLSTFEKAEKEPVPISREQMGRFAGNMLQVHNARGEKLLVMSTRAYESLDPSQIAQLTSFNRIIHAPLDTIETNGGGSARCMMAEIHLPPL